MEINAMNDPETRDNVRKFIHYLSAYQRAFNLPGYIFKDLNHMCADAVFRPCALATELAVQRIKTM